LAAIVLNYNKFNYSGNL